MHVDTSTEFWQGRSSLLVTDEHNKDADVPEEVRVYLIAGTQHAGPAMLRHNDVFFKNHRYPLNSLNYGCLNRALLTALQEWVSQGTLPPHSRFPRVDDGTLISPSREAGFAFPRIPGVDYIGIINGLSVLDYNYQPPQPIPDRNYAVLVPRLTRTAMR
jgi:hypothetical protein